MSPTHAAGGGAAEHGGDAAERGGTCRDDPDGRGRAAGAVPATAHFLGQLELGLVVEL